MPKASVISKFNLRLDGGYMQYMQKKFDEDMKDGGMARFLKCDSSEQGSRDWLMNHNVAVKRKELASVAESHDALLDLNAQLNAANGDAE